jgi:hypothetical protein
VVECAVAWTNALKQQQSTALNSARLMLKALMKKTEEYFAETDMFRSMQALVASLETGS